MDYLGVKRSVGVKFGPVPKEPSAFKGSCARARPQVKATAIFDLIIEVSMDKGAEFRIAKAFLGRRVATSPRYSLKCFAVGFDGVVHYFTFHILSLHTIRETNCLPSL